MRFSFKNEHESSRENNRNETIDRDGDHDPFGDGSGHVDRVVDELAHEIGLIGDVVVELHACVEANEME